ncbi:MAG: Hsp33 family molecular chaperone HslO [Bacillus sp. (in: Bacteria)]|nr:Hsp33 family molecular chaperone HslO [Bacillus sp. (in: firmicutes)]
MSSKKEQDNPNKPFLEWLDEPFGEEEDTEVVIFRCIDCKKEDEVPGFIIDEFSYDLEKGEEVEIVCPFCNGTMREARDVPSD